MIDFGGLVICNESPVDIRGIYGSWHSGYYVIKIASPWIVVSRPYLVVNGKEKTTQLTLPVAFPADRVRLTENPEKLRVYGCYKADNFLKDYGNKMLEWYEVVYTKI